MSNEQLVNPDVKFSQRFEYHRNLTGRRWQYFAGFTAVDALLLNAWPQIQGADPATKAVLCLGFLAVTCAILRLISRARSRIRANAQELNRLAQEEILQVAKGVIGFSGITLWLYLSVLALSVPWFVVLFSSSGIAFGLGLGLVLATCATLDLYSKT